MTEEVLLPTSRSTDLPGFKVFSDGSELPGTVNMISVMVDKTVNKVPMARLLFKDGDAAEGSFLLSSGKELVPGKKIKIEAGYHNDFKTIFKGIAVKQNLRIKGKGNSFLEVECKDESYRMTVGRMNRYFSDATDSEAMEQVIGSYSDIEKDVQSTGVEHREMVQYHSSDWDFILCRAEANGRLVMADDGKITIKKPDFSADPTVTVTYGATVLRFDGVLDATHQQKTVSCRAWDAANQEMASVDAADPGISKAGNIGSADLSGKVTEDTSLNGHTGNLPTDELQAWADAMKMRNELSRLRGVVTCNGLPQLKPGQMMKLQGFGDRFNGKVFVTGVRHQISDGSWEMDVQFGLSPEFHSQKTDIRETPATGLLPSVSGLQIGVVSPIAG